MANVIISEDFVTDGYDVRVSRDGKNPETAHFSSQPSDVQAAVDDWAVRMAAIEAAEAAADDWEIVEE